MAFLEFLLNWGQYFLIAFCIGFPLQFIVGAMARGRRWVGSLGTALFIPGCILHELGHAIACLVTGKRITHTNFGTNPLKTNGGSVSFEHATGLCTPLAYHAIAYAPVISCGIATAYILGYLTFAYATLNVLEKAIWIFLLVSVASGASPSIPDMKLAYLSLKARPRVTAVEVLSLGWPLLLPDLLGVESDMALVVYLVAVVLSYIVLWQILVSPHPHAFRWRFGKRSGVRPTLPGDGRDPRGERWPDFSKGGNLPTMVGPARYSRGVDIQLPVATVEDVYRAAGIKVKPKKAKLDMEVFTDG